jgi:hypothetical protein
MASSRTSAGAGISRRKGFARAQAMLQASARSRRYFTRAEASLTILRGTGRACMPRNCGGEIE